MSVVSITREIRINAPTMAVWSVLSTPSQQPVVEPRVHLVSEWGEPGTLDSGYELAMRGRPTMRLQVTDVVPGERHVVAVSWNGRTRGSQDARLRADGADCILTYTFSVEVPLALRPIQRAFGNRQLGRWLDAVAHVSSAPHGSR
ncbi:hypothetical protein GCM10023350_48840 [Nocardioides endophyticus]|uniref:SRPBCC family protein n=1 Tax=Nocardioides endophyticus TaxID=1353775 RepID=A0ABP8ZI78_9ACTN